jgi:hypothetical protein
MSGRKTDIVAQKTALSDNNHSRKHGPDTLEPVRTGRNMVGGSTHWLGHFRCDGRTAHLARQVLVGTGKMNKKKRNALTGKKAGRPVSSNDVRLNPHFNNPIDIEKLGKALVAIALKQSVSLDDGGSENTHAEGDGNGLAE